MEQVYIAQTQQPDVNKMTFADLLAQVNQQEQAKPIQERIASDIWARDIQNGLNNSNSLVDAWQTANNIRRPQTMDEIEQARAGQFNQSETISSGVAKPSIYDTISSGFEENYNNNLFQNLKNGEQGSGWAYKLGQGLGTVGKFVDSPLGRGLIAGGIMAAAGGSPALALGTGFTAGVGRQNYATADKLYRQQLKQYGYTDQDLANIKGNVTGDMYKNLTNNLWRNQKLTADQYSKNLKQLNYLHTTGQINDDTYSKGLMTLNNALDSNELGKLDVNGVQDSNQTRNTNSQIDYREQRLQQLNRALDIAQQRVNKMGATDADRAMLNRLKAQQYQLENQILSDYIGNSGNGNGGNPRPVGQSSGSGLKLVNVRNK